MNCPPSSNTSHPAMISSSGRNPTKASEGLVQRPYLPASWTSFSPRLYCVLTALCTCLFPSTLYTCNDLFMSLWAVWGHGPCLRLHYNRQLLQTHWKFACLQNSPSPFYLGVFVLLVLYLGQSPPLLPFPQSWLLFLIWIPAEVQGSQSRPSRFPLSE